MLVVSRRAQCVPVASSSYSDVLWARHAMFSSEKDYVTSQKSGNLVHKVFLKFSLTWSRTFCTKYTSEICFSSTIRFSFSKISCVRNHLSQYFVTGQVTRARWLVPSLSCYLQYDNKSKWHMHPPRQQRADYIGLSVLFLADGYAMLRRPNKAETAVHGCHCPGDMVVRMR